MTETTSTPTRVKERALPSSFRTAVVVASLIRGVALRQGGMYVARILAALGVVSTLLAMVRLARDFGPDRATLRIAAWGAYAITWVGAVPAALAFAQRGRAEQAHAGFEALGRARGVSMRVLRGAEIGACVQGLAEVVLAPNLALACAAGALAIRGSMQGGARVLWGGTLFGVFAAVLLGVVTGCCRCWGGRHGRLWLLGAVLGPWLVSTFLPFGALGAWLSIPGLLEHVWRTLTVL